MTLSSQVLVLRGNSGSNASPRRLEMTIGGVVASDPFAEGGLPVGSPHIAFFCLVAAVTGIADMDMAAESVLAAFSCGAANRVRGLPILIGAS